VTSIVIVGGGTGGHLFPGLAVAEELRACGVAVSWIGARRGLEANRVPPTGIPTRLLPVSGAVGRGRLASATAVAALVPGVATAALHLLRASADAVLSVGGYAALPGALAAGMIGVPLVIQEQNALPGVTNHLLAPWADAIACGFSTAVGRFPSLPARWTGNPVRPEFFAVPATPTGTATVLVTGGSQGSAFLNRLMPEALATLRPESRPRVVHQCGTRWVDDVRGRYAERAVPAEVVGFMERPGEALATATLVVARAGALSVTELAAARRFALLVPFAAAAHDHQSHNAAALAAQGAAEVVEEAAATPRVVAETLARLLADPRALAARGERGAVLARRGAARDVAELVLSRAGGARLPASSSHEEGSRA
jgi:UDP-N-acetylglucosamine--N-acetylmuramyl-(pentapeptide) pyrophosphoryl-undecaprenol N-acetylglucosamine transferase